MTTVSTSRSNRFILASIGVVAAAGCFAALSVAAPASAATIEPSTEVQGVHVDSGFDPSKGVEVAGAENRGLSVDGSPAQARVSSCEVWRNAVAIPGGYRNSVNGCALIGANNSVSVIYAWTRTGGTSKSKACVQGKGFNAIHAPIWQNAGCGTGGSTGIFWGNVAANKQIRSFASSGLTVNINWR